MSNRVSLFEYQAKLLGMDVKEFKTKMKGLEYLVIQTLSEGKIVDLPYVLNLKTITKKVNYSFNGVETNDNVKVQLVLGSTYKTTFKNKFSSRLKNKSTDLF